jgi:hypothetical protein
MKQDLFVTTVYKGNFELSNQFLNKFDNWANFEKDLDPSGCKYSTTQNGWQYSFNLGEKPPLWFGEIVDVLSNIKEELKFKNIKSSWVVDYEKGGYQDPHFHQPENNLYTIILNFHGNGELLLFDPRPIATCQGFNILEVETLKPGSWIAIPSWLVHSSRPSKDRRIIYVLDVYN